MMTMTMMIASTLTPTMTAMIHIFNPVSLGGTVGCAVVVTTTSSTARIASNCRTSARSNR